MQANDGNDASPWLPRPKTRHLRFTWIWAHRPSIKGSKLLFPVIKATKIKISSQTSASRSRRCVACAGLISRMGRVASDFSGRTCLPWKNQPARGGNVISLLTGGEHAKCCSWVWSQTRPHRVNLFTCYLNCMCLILFAEFNTVPSFFCWFLVCNDFIFWFGHTKIDPLTFSHLCSLWKGMQFSASLHQMNE